MPALDYARCYHQGVRVPDLDAAMAELGAALSLEWCQPQEREQAVWLPGVGATTVPLRFTYSAAGPQHIELLQGASGLRLGRARRSRVCTTSDCGPMTCQVRR